MNGTIKEFTKKEFDAFIAKNGYETFTADQVLKFNQEVINNQNLFTHILCSTPLTRFAFFFKDEPDDFLPYAAVGNQEFGSGLVGRFRRFFCLDTGNNCSNDIILFV